MNAWVTSRMESGDEGEEQRNTVNKDWRREGMESNEKTGRRK